MRKSNICGLSVKPTLVYIGGKVSRVDSPTFCQTPALAVSLVVTRRDKQTCLQHYKINYQDNSLYSNSRF